MRAVAQVGDGRVAERAEFVEAAQGCGQHQQITRPQRGAAFDGLAGIAPAPAQHAAPYRRIGVGFALVLNHAFHVGACLDVVPVQPAPHLQEGHRQTLRRRRRTTQQGVDPIGGFVRSEIGAPNHLDIGRAAARPMQEQRHVGRRLGHG